MEHISIEINKDFGRYKHNFFLGYTLSECFFFFLGALCCIFIILPMGLWFHVDLFIAGWCGVIPASAVIYIGNHQRDGMSEIEYQKKIYALRKMRQLPYSSEETKENILELLSEEIKTKEIQEKKKIKPRKSNGSKIVKIAITAGIFISMIALAFIIVPHKVKQKQVAEVKQEAMASQIVSKEKTTKIATEKKKVTRERKVEENQKTTAQKQKDVRIKKQNIEQVTETRKESVPSRKITKKKKIFQREIRSNTNRKRSIATTASKPKRTTEVKKKSTKKQEKTTETKKETPSKVSSTEESSFEVEYETK